MAFRDVFLFGEIRIKRRRMGALSTNILSIVQEEDEMGTDNSKNSSTVCKYFRQPRDS